MDHYSPKTVRHALLGTAAFVVLLSGCTKDITVDLPVTEPKVVVEGTIETGQPPFVILSTTQSFFAPTSVAAIAGAFISDAVVTVNDGINTYPLDRICSNDIPDSLLGFASAATGIDVALLQAANICVWTKLNDDLDGVEGRTYQLNVQTLDRTVTATTTIPNGVALDSLWFKLALQQPNDDSLGFVYARLTDPDTLGNAYRWYAQRINLGTDGEPKDSRFIAPLFSVFEDKYVNGLAFDFFFNRGSEPYSEADDDNNEESGYFKRNDTVVVKFASIGVNEYRFYNSFANNVATQGDLFSNPSNVRSNVEGGIGVWAGLATRLDTVVCVP